MKFGRIIFNQCRSQEEKEPVFRFTLISRKKKALMRPALGISVRLIHTAPPEPPITSTPRAQSAAHPIWVRWSFLSTQFPLCFLEVLLFPHFPQLLGLLEVPCFCLLLHI